jgi:hypothetical protein
MRLRYGLYTRGLWNRPAAGFSCSVPHPSDIVGHARCRDRKSPISAALGVMSTGAGWRVDEANCHVAAFCYGGDDATAVSYDGLTNSEARRIAASLRHGSRVVGV